MAYGYKIRSALPYLPDYAAAAAHEAAVVGLRHGNNKGLKPLGERSAKHMSIRRESDDSIIVKLYHTDFLRYYPDGRLELDTGRFASTTNNDVFNCVTGGGMTTFDRRTWVYCQHSGFDNGFGCMPIGKQATFMLANGVTPAIISEAALPEVHTINKRKMNLLRKHYAGFRKYGRGLLKLLVGPAEGEEGQRAFFAAAATAFGSKGKDWRGREIPDFNAGVTPPQSTDDRLAGYIQLMAENRLSDEEQHKAVLFMACATLSHYQRPSESTFDKALTRAILLAHPDVLERKIVTSGKPVRDPYEFAVEQS